MLPLCQCSEHGLQDQLVRCAKEGRFPVLREEHEETEGRCPDVELLRYVHPKQGQEEYQFYQQPDDTESTPLPFVINPDRL